MQDVTAWQHEHRFGTDVPASGERRTRWVVGITLAMMAGEIVAGSLYGSMALLADGWHMGTHAAALGVTLFAYVYARRHAGDARYSFGTGKVGALGGFASAVGLAVVALLVVGESARRLAAPVTIRFDEAIAVAVLGLAVNLACAWLLRDHDHDHGSGQDHGRGLPDGPPQAREHADHHHEHDRHAHGHHRDHNLRAAYLHVLADALTSVLAIAALVAGRSLGWTWMDPVMGLVGGVVIARWSWSLLRETARVLLDGEVSETRRRAMVRAVERDAEARVADLHVWRVGPRHLAAIVSVVSRTPRAPSHYRALLAEFEDLAHVTIEVHPAPEG
jgi:cation diffusion facilitator family transporter